MYCYCYTLDTSYYVNSIHQLPIPSPPSLLQPLQLNTNLVETLQPRFLLPHVPSVLLLEIFERCVSVRANDRVSVELALIVLFQKPRHARPHAPSLPAANFPAAPAPTKPPPIQKNPWTILSLTCAHCLAAAEIVRPSK